jgi:hypothetical protein
MRFLKNWIFGKDLTDAIHATKVVRAGGVRFKIKRINVLNHMEGLNVLIQTYATYDQKRQAEKLPEPDAVKLLEKIKPIYRDIFLAGVVHPKLVAKKGEPGQLVDDLFDDWDICHDLYEQIMTFTNKKKTKRPTSLNRSY